MLVPRTTKEIKIHSKFIPLFKGGYTYYGFYGGRGSGKSFTVAYYAIQAAMQGKETILTVRKHKNSNDQSTKALYKDIIEDLGLLPRFDITNTKIVDKFTGSVFNFTGLEVNPRNVKSMANVTLTIIEEAADINPEAFFILKDTVIRKKGSRMICIWNPVSPNDAVDQFFRGGICDPKLMYTSKVNYMDNLALNDLEILPDIERDKHINYGRYAHRWLGEYENQTSRRIFPNVEEGIILDLSKYTPFYGLDFGVNDPNALVRCFIIEEDNHYGKKVIYIDKTLSKNGNIEEFTELMKNVVHDTTATISCDSSGPHFIQIVNKVFPNAIGAVKGRDSVKSGINWLQGYRIVVDPTCKDILHEFANYSLKADTTKIDEHGEFLMQDVPIDKDNHLIDALRYATEDYRLMEKKLIHNGYSRVI